jgi:hypothetical protein
MESQMIKSYGTIIFADPKHLDQITQALHELDKQSDRAAAIVGAAILDLVITFALMTYLHKHRDKKLTEKFFSISGPVGNLGPKIDLAFLIGLVSSDTHRDLVNVKDIRNAFAHKLSVSDFKSEKIAALSRNLKIAEIRTFEADKKAKEWPKGCWMSVGGRKQILADPRERFLLTVRVLCYGFSIASKTAMPTAIF